MKTKKQICLEAYEFVSQYESISFNTFYKRVFKDSCTGNFRYIGKSYDYTL